MKYRIWLVHKKITAYFLFLLISLIIASCGGGNSEGEGIDIDVSVQDGTGTDPGNDTPPTVPDTPVIVVPTTQSGSVDSNAIGGTGLKILSASGGETLVSDEDGFSTSVSTEGTQLLLAVDSDGELRGLTLSVIPIEQTDSSDEIIPDILPLDATSTALGILYMVPGILSVDPALTQVRISALEQLACFDSFVNFLQDNLPSRSLNDLVTEGTLQSHVVTCVDEWRAIVAGRPAPGVDIRLRLPQTGPYYNGSDNPAKFVLGITDKSDPSAVDISYFHGGYRSIHVLRADFFEGITISPKITKLGRMNGIRSFTLGSLFTGTLGDPPTPKTDTVDFEARDGSITSQYWVIGPGFVSGSEVFLPELQSEIDSVENGLWFSTVWEYLAKPLLGPLAPKLNLIQVAANAEAGISIATDIATIKTAGNSSDRLAALGGLSKNILDIVIEEWSPQSAAQVAGKSYIKAFLSAAGPLVAGVNAGMFVSELSSLPRISMFEIENIKPVIEIVSPGQGELIFSETGLVDLNAIYTPVGEISLSLVVWEENAFPFIPTNLVDLYNFSEGPHSITLRVVDQDGAENTDDVSFNVVSAIILGPNSTVLNIGDEPIQMSITDGLGNSLSQDRFQWSVENNDTPVCDFSGTGQVVSVSNGPIETTGTPAGYISPISIGSATVTATHVSSGLVASASINVEGPCPDINVKQGANTLVHSENIIQYNFGEIQVGESSVAATFTIENLGLIDLDIGSVVSNDAEFAVTGPALTNIPSNQNTSFSVVFTPTAAGVIQASITILSNDENESPFFFLLEGTGVVHPEISVSIGGVEILPGPSFAHDFGVVELGQTSVEATFTIRNTGTSPLVIEGVSSLISPDFDYFQIIQPVEQIIQIDGSTTFKVTFAPRILESGPNFQTIAGPVVGGFSIISNDLDNPSFSIRVTGTNPCIVQGGGGTSFTAQAICSNYETDPQEIFWSERQVGNLSGPFSTLTAGNVVISGEIYETVFYRYGNGSIYEVRRESRSTNLTVQGSARNYPATSSSFVSNGVDFSTTTIDGGNTTSIHTSCLSSGTGSRSTTINGSRTSLSIPGELPFSACPTAAMVDAINSVEPRFLPR